jgi:hypothetical protein
MNKFYYLIYFYIYFFTFQIFFFYIYKFIKFLQIDIEILKNNIIEGNKDGFIRIENKFIFIKKGKYILNGNNNDINIIIKSNNIILFFNNSKYNSNFLPTILIENNIINTIIYFNNSIISSSYNYPIIKLKKNSDIIIYAFSIIFKGGIYFSGESENNIYINGLFKFKKKYIHKKGKLKINYNFNLYCENYLINAKELLIQIHPIMNNIDINESIIQKLNTNFSNLLFNKIFILKFLKSVNDLINLNEKVIVSMTSWKKRINNAHKPIEILINNTYKPDKIILNLAVEEFPKKNLELPKSILRLLNFNNFEIFWVYKNNNVFKKLIPTINRFKNDLIITVDDDIIYPFDLIENVIKNFIKFGSNKPMSFGNKYSDWIINKTRISSHFGPCTIVKYEFFQEKLNKIYKETTEELVNKNVKCFDDILYTYAALINGYQYLRIKNYSIKNYQIKSKFQNYAFSEEYSKTIINQMKDYHYLLRNYIFEKYNITIDNLLKKNIIKKFFNIKKFKLNFLFK